MSSTDPLAPYRAEAIQTAKDFGIEVTKAQIEEHAHRLLTMRTEAAAVAADRPRRVVTPIPEWLSYEPAFDAHGNPFGRRYYTADGYEALPGLGRLAQGTRPNRWYVYGPDNFVSEATTIAGIIRNIEYGRNRATQS